jgi:uncharacterized membrane protein
MSCFSMDWLLHVLILCVLVGGTIAILQIVIPYALSKMGATIGEGARVVIRVFKVLLWCAVAIVVLYIVFMLIACLWSMGGGFSLLPHK